MRRLLTSAALIAGAAGVIALGTQSFFSDTETSSGNVFAAGDIDLQLANTGYYNGAAHTATTWTLKDLTIEKFFDYSDVKPGDYGEGTVQVRVGSNPAFVCANVDITENNENTLTEPELNEADTAATGELASNLNFAIWRDDGDNVYETGEVVITSGPASNVLDGGTLTLADSDTNNIGGTVGQGVPANGSFYLGQAWCFGTMTATGLPPAAYTNPVTATNFDDGATDIVDSRDGGFTCSGVGGSNLAQTDSLKGNVSFYAVQTRNNPTFQCTDELFPSPSPTPTGSPTTLVGAALGGYDDPATCADTVSTTESVQAAIDAAAPGSTVCVDSTYTGAGDTGTYIEIPATKTGLILAGVGAAGTADLDLGVLVSADNAKVTGLNLGISTHLSETFGVYVNSNVDGAEVSYNTITGTSTASGRGIVNATGTTTNAVYKHNSISNWLTGVFLNPSSNMVVEYNDLFANGVGVGNDNPTNNMIRYNDIENNTIEGIGALLNGAESLTVMNNNITGNPASKDLVSYGATTVNAENNWWGDTDASNNVTGPVDFDPEALSAFTEN